MLLPINLPYILAMKCFSRTCNVLLNAGNGIYRFSLICKHLYHKHAFAFRLCNIQKRKLEIFCSSVYATCRRTRRSKVASLFRTCDISFNAEVASRISLPRMRYIVERGGRDSSCSSAFRDILHTRKTRNMSFSGVSENATDNYTCISPAWVACLKL